MHQKQHILSEKFDELYKKLNPEQRTAVDAIEGPVIVIAGPGTGKTSILTLRISNILKQTDTQPENILALTFTESGVHSIRKKLVDIVGAVGYRVPICTFHSFCNDIIKNFPQEFPRIIGAQHMTDVDQISILEDLIQTTELESLKPAGSPLFYLKSILSFIKELKREDVSPAEYRKHVSTFKKDLESIEDFRHEKGAYKGEIKAKYKPAIRKIENSTEFATLYEKYQEVLTEKRLYDYEDMIIEVLRELRENNDLLLELQETYQYVLADEHQDANRGQNRLLELLSGFHEQPNLFVVGDEKQAIFRFQGASLENFLYFKRRFPQATMISLSKNYRSTQGILDASHSLIENNYGEKKEADEASDEGAKSLRIRLESKSPEKTANISVFECDSPQAEAMFVAQDILKQRIPAEQITVLFRDNRDADLIARTFEKYGIPYVLHTDIDVMADTHIQKLLLILRAINNFGDDKLLAPVLFVDLLGLNHLDVFKIFKKSKEARRSIVEIMKSVGDLQNAGVENPQQCTALFSRLHDLSVVAKNKSLIDSLQEIVTQIGFVGFVLARPRAVEIFAAYDAFLSHAAELQERHKKAKLADYLQLLDKMSTHNVSVRAKGVATHPGKVNLMTAHKSKGLEFDRVYCMHVNDGKWGGRRSPGYFLPIMAQGPDELENDISDERRLLYVALTRARHEIVLTYATHNASGREMLPSRFLAEIDPSLVQCAIAEKQPAHTVPEALFSHSTNTESGLKNKEYLAQIFLEQGFSVSALNNYLSCPWRFFFLNLIRIPRVEDRSQLYGTAVHATLKVFFDSYKEDREMLKAELLIFFENFLNRSALSDSDYQLFLKKGKESLGGYYDTYNGTWPKSIFNEFTVSGVHIPFAEDQVILLRGQLDKVELLDGSNVNVVDYKTGNPKSRADIEGETKSSEGNYKRQLVFYKLLLEKFDPARFQVRTGEIDFVEPNKQGKYKRERFEVTDEDVEELTRVIVKAAQEILTLSFWNTNCDDPECEFCSIRKIVGI